MGSEFADEGFVVLIQIPVKGGPPQRASYLVGRSTEEEAKAAVRVLYRDEGEIVLAASPMKAVDLVGWKVRPGDVLPWT